MFKYLEVFNMRFSVGNDDCCGFGRIETVSVDDLVEIIKSDVADGKWNCYDGGRINSIEAVCRFDRKGVINHNRLFIFGSKNEFKSLEEQLDGVLTVIPRDFRSEDERF